MVSFSAPVQNHPVFAPGAVFSPSSGAKPPRFCTWRRVPTALRCKTAPFPHLAPRFPRPPVQNHPVFAPGAAFSPSSGAKPPRFCTRPGVFPALRCKTAPFPHLAPRFPRPPVQNHPVFAPGAAFFPALRCKTTSFLHLAPCSSRLPQIQGRGGKVVIHRMLRKRGCPENNTLFCVNWCEPNT